jgi:hypothetical protein
MARFDSEKPQADGSFICYSEWNYDPSISGLKNARLIGTKIRRTVYVLGKPDTAFTIPAACVVKGHTVRGYIKRGDEYGDTGKRPLVFQVYNAHRHLLGI